MTKKSLTTGAEKYLNYVFLKNRRSFIVKQWVIKAALLTGSTPASLPVQRSLRVSMPGKKRRDRGFLLAGRRSLSWLLSNLGYLLKTLEKSSGFSILFVWMQYCSNRNQQAAGVPGRTPRHLVSSSIVLFLQEFYTPPLLIETFFLFL
jgi:hypothetical protein